MPRQITNPCAKIQSMLFLIGIKHRAKILGKAHRQLVLNKMDSLGVIGVHRLALVCTNVVQFLVFMITSNSGLVNCKFSNIMRLWLSQLCSIDNHSNSRFDFWQISDK